ncbi:MAG: ParB/RepB/Spo0J family partition protein [Oscillospiraceae bacterium]|jgi:ParB family chromosome partitioning protein|nr:ParB/RepB/Spo0J family partition protein [Oscillospiraceae bacterium]
MKKGLGKGLDSIFLENINEDQNNTIVLPITEIEPNADQPRREFDEERLQELSASIAEHGLLQPILVRPLLGGGYEIVAGERRYRAARMAQLTEVPVVVRDLSDSQTMELALIENLQRENLNALEEAQGYKALIEQYGFSQEEVAASVGKSRPAVANALRLLALPEDIKILLVKNKISAGHGRALLGLKDIAAAHELAALVEEKELSVRQTEKLVKEYNEFAENEGKSRKKKPEKLAKAFVETQLALTEHLGRKVKIVPAKNKEGGTLQIEFYSEEELKELAKVLGKY